MSKRGFEELKSKSHQTLKEVENEIQRRDRNDSTRNLSPLKPAPDAIIIDSTNLTVNEVVDLMVSYIMKSARAESQLGRNK